MSSNESIPEFGKTAVFDDKIEITNMCERPITVDSEAKLFEMVSILKLEVSELQRKEEKSCKTLKCLESERLR